MTLANLSTNDTANERYKRLLGLYYAFKTELEQIESETMDLRKEVGKALDKQKMEKVLKYIAKQKNN